MLSRRAISFSLLVALVPVLVAGGAARDRQPRPGPRTGSPLFPLEPASTVTLEAPPSAPAAWDETTAYVPLRSGLVVAVSLETGRTRWTADMTAGGAPATAGGLVFVAAGETLRALDATDGAVEWERGLDGSLSAPLHADEGRVLAGTGSGEIYAFAAADGQPLWQHQYGAPLAARPDLDESHVYVPLEDGRVLAVTNAAGAPAWERRLGGRPADVRVAGARVYVGADDNAFYCLSARSGRIEWRWAAGGDIVGAPLVDARRVYFVALDHVLRALDRASGVQRWRASLPARPGGGPIPLGGLLLTAGIAPTMYAFGRQDGILAGSAAAADELLGLPHVVSGLIEADTTVHVLTGTGRLQALRSALTRLPAAPAPGGARDRDEDNPRVR